MIWIKIFLVQTIAFQGQAYGWGHRVLQNAFSSKS